MNKLLYYFIWLVLLSAIGLILLCGFWLLYPYKTVTFKDVHFKIVNKKIKAGGVLEYISDYCKYGNYSAEVTRSFINGIIYSMPSVTTNRDMGCHQIKVLVKVPPDLPIGSNYYINMLYKIKVNPIRDIIIEHRSEIFSITESTVGEELRLRGY